MRVGAVRYSIRLGPLSLRPPAEKPHFWLAPKTGTRGGVHNGLSAKLLKLPAVLLTVMSISSSDSMMKSIAADAGGRLGSENPSDRIAPVALVKLIPPLYVA